MYGYINLGDEGEPQIWAAMGHGDEMLCSIRPERAREIYTACWEMGSPGSSDPDYGIMADEIVHVFVSSDHMGCEFGDDFRAAILQAIEPGAPIADSERLRFKF